MQLLQHSQLTPGAVPRSVVTVGNFDGVHRGHRTLLLRVAERARELRASGVVYTFHPHPLKILNPARCPPQITSFEERLELIAAEGIDATVRAGFDRDYAAQKPEVFARDTLAGALGAVEVWVGPDFAFGRGRAGTIDLLRRVGHDAGFAVQVLRPFTWQGEVVSSTRIRQAIREADFTTADRFLGRPHCVHGPVVHGAGRGRGLGFPTANILPREDCIPGPGVYAAWVEFDSGWQPAAVNVGPNPTFGGTETSVEAFLLDFSGDLYGMEARLRFVERVRGEIAFRDAAALVRQVEQDVAVVRRTLADNPPPQLRERQP